MKIFTRIITGLMFFSFLFTPVFVLAGNTAATPDTGCTQTKTAAGTNIMVCNLKNPLSNISGNTSVPAVIQILIKAALGIVGGLTLFMFVWGGFQWLISAGNEERVKNGTNTMLWAVIGLVLVFTSYFILSAFTNYLTSAPQ